MQRRKDPKGKVLKDGERYKAKEDRYTYRWTDKMGKRHEIYAKTLDELRKKESELTRDIFEGIKTADENLTVNDIYKNRLTDKKGLRSSTRGNYIYMYEQYVRDGFGKIRIKDVKKSDIRRFYNELHGLSFNTIEVIQNVLNQVFTLAVDDDYIRKNPAISAFVQHRRNGEGRKGKA